MKIFNQKEEMKKQKEIIDKIQPFLQELSELTKKHGVVISGCGCCGSPFLYFTNKEDGCYEISNFEVSYDNEIIYNRLQWQDS